MQIMVDFNVETPEALDSLSRFVAEAARLKRAAELPTGFNTEAAEAEAVASVPTGTPAAPPVPQVPAPPVPAQARDPRDKAFRGHTDSTPVIVPPLPSNVVPFVPAPPVPVVTAATVPAVNTVSPAQAPANSAASVTGVTAPVELDKSGMPWDARIHSKNKSTKQDGTWRLLKNVDKALLEAVTQELHARMINSTGPSVSAPAAEVPAAPSFPGALPLPPVPVGNGTENLPASYSPAGVPVPPVPAPGNVFGKSPLPPGVVAAPLPGAPVTLPAVPPVPVPPAHAVGMPDATNAPVVQSLEVTEYRAFVAKAMQARNDGRLSADAVSAVVQQAGAPSIQLLGNMTHLLPRANFILDATLAGWTREQIAAHIAVNGP